MNADTGIPQQPQQLLRILIIDDEIQMCISLKTLLEKEGFLVDYSTNARKAYAMHNQKSYNLMICDIRMPEMGGLAFLSKLGTKIPIVMITAHASVETARQAFKLGASDYLTKPFKFDELLVVVKQFVKKKPKKRDSGTNPVLMQSTNRKYNQVLELAEKFSATDIPILITGESGTGKEVLADYIYELNKQQVKQEAFVKINCAAIPRDLLEGELFGYEKGAFTGAVTGRSGKIEEADGGILFLDEIGDMPLVLQAKLLRVVQDLTVYHIGSNKPIYIKTRIIAASNQNLQALVDNGQFRLDLYHRLKGVHLRLPALRERQEDIEPLSWYFLKKFSHKYDKIIQSIDTKVFTIFRNYNWPGNIRELKYCIERSVVVCDDSVLQSKHLPDNIYYSEVDSQAPPVEKDVEDFSSSMESYRAEYMKKVIINALQKTNGNKVEASRLLNISRQTLYNRIKELNIQNEFK
jgi:DNA-binding NtrC family response regulator